MSESTRIVLLVIMVAFIALAGGRFILRRRGSRERPALFRMGTATYLAVGLILGQGGVGILDERVLENLGPVVELCLGWIGLLFGLQCEFRRLRRYPPGFPGLTVFQSVVTVGALAGLMYLALGRFMPQDEESFWRVLALLCLAGAVSSPAETALAASSLDKLRRKFARLAHYITSLDSFFPVFLFAILAGFYHSTGGGSLFAALEWTVASVMVGLLLGLLFCSYARHRHSENELLLMVVAFAVFSGGIAAYLELSSLFISMVMGLTMANFLSQSEKVFRVLARREKPILIVFLVLVGGTWTPVPEGESVAALAFLLVLFLAARLAGKLCSMAIAKLLFGGRLEPEVPWGAGLALLGQGGMSVALIANYQLLFGERGWTAAVSVALVAVVISEAFAAYSARFVLRREGMGER